MPLTLPPLPYPYDALQPHISERTLRFHHDKHHAGYLKRVAAAVAGTPDEGRPLEEIVVSAEPGDLFNSAAQAWNHDFYWRSMSPDGGGDPTGDLAAALADDFGSVDEWRAQFAAGAGANFGSGWGWLVRRPDDGRLAVVQTDDAGTPLTDGLTPLAVIDVWEHAYYLDYQNDRAAYVAGFVEHLVDWEFVQANFDAARRAG
ncbi:MAG TPA: superoxide dismutase [Fe] [Acidimicrobiaceae bacterium]|nr:superoxide dismutase [Fe] [Acidimicrobiaceae bacterium]